MERKLLHITQNAQQKLLMFFPKYYCRRNWDYITVNLVDLTQNYCNYLTDEIARRLAYPKVLQPKISATKYYFLVSNLSSVGTLASTWVSKRPTRVVICDPVKDSLGVLQETFEALWNKKFFKLLIIFVQDSLKVTTYNPFEKQVLDLQSHYFPDCFENKIKDINGYNFKVAMIVNPPQTIKVNGEWFSKDFSLLQLVISALNATLEVVEVPQIKDYRGVYNILEREKAECTFVGLIQGNDNDELDFFNSHITDGFVALTPKSSQQIVTILTVFDLEVWLYLVFSLLILIILFAIYKKYNLFGSFNTLDLMSITILTVLLTIFQSGISSTLTKIKYEKDINTMDDLLKSGLPIWGFSRSKVVIEALAGYQLQSQTTNKDLLYQMVTNGYSDRVYILPFYVALEFQKIRKNDRKLYSIMAEPLFPSFRIFFFRKNSPFLEEVANIVLLLRQAGLIPKLYDQNQATYQNDDNQVVYLKLMHLSSVFGLLLIGLLISTICFLYETLGKKLRTQEKKQNNYI